MDRRNALKALASVVGATGMTVTPATTQELQGVELVLLKCSGRMSNDTAARIAEYWKLGVEGTALEHTRVVVLSDGIEAEFVRTR